jgi:hypothetical protein
MLKMLISALLALAVALPSAWTLMEYKGGEPKLFDRIDAALASQPPQARDVARAFGLPEGCTRKGCLLSAGKIDNLSYSNMSIRPGSEGFIFAVDDIGGSCVPTAMVKARYGSGEAEEVCYDAPCWYSTAHHSWGILAFQLASPTATCISSVLINSLPEQRPRR